MILFFVEYRYVKYNPSCDMLITGIRKENLISYITINIKDEPDESDGSRLISCTSFMDQLMNSLSSLIENMESISIVDLKLYWSHILIQTNMMYNMLQNNQNNQQKPKKFVCIAPDTHLITAIIEIGSFWSIFSQIGDFNGSLMLMKRRVDHIVQLVNSVAPMNSSIRGNDLSSLESTLKAFKHIVHLYKEESRQMNVIDDLDFPLFVEVMATIKEILDINYIPEEVRYAL